jgi:non-ribosomal peptide synthetase component E (peptide arylation enzyme)
VPLDIALIEELPRKPQGKVDKQKLAERDDASSSED